jgi:hypothetical protein
VRPTLASPRDHRAPTRRHEPLLTLSDAARRLEVPLEELTRAVVHHQIDFKLVDGIPHIPMGALEGYQRAS